jgi:hypothetical protein
VKYKCRQFGQKKVLQGSLTRLRRLNVSLQHAHSSFDFLMPNVLAMKSEILHMMMNASLPRKLNAKLARAEALKLR